MFVTRLVCVPFIHPCFNKNSLLLKASKSKIKSKIRNTSVASIARHGLFIKPLEDIYPKVPCKYCNGTGAVICDVCDGKGSLGKGGFHKKNPIALDRIIGSKWTALERTFGWRHFFVQSKQRGAGKEWFIEMVATCDKNTHFWINAKNLKERQRWSMGWLQKDELLQESQGVDHTPCKACKGDGKLKCKTCLLKKDNKAKTADIDKV